MSFTEEKVTVTKGNGLHVDETYTHPAFGVLEVSRVQIGGRGIELFDSALNHTHVIRVRVARAEMTRNLHDNRVHSRVGDTICEFMLSEAQWAHFVSSQGISDGTPATFTCYRKDNFTHVPGIKSEEKMKETFSREIREKAAKDIAEAKQIAADLQALIESGKMGKKELREIQGRMATFSGNFASNMAFTQDQFAEAMEKTVEAGKSEIDAYVTNTALRLGVGAMQHLPALKHDKE